MPLIDLTNVQENSGTYQQLEPGAYVVRITSVNPDMTKQYLMIEWDVAEGPHAGIYKKSKWPPRDFLSWKDSALGMLKHRLHVLSDANSHLTAVVSPNGNFASVKEFDTDNFNAFIGCIFGANVRKRFYEKDDGTTGEGIEIGAWLSPEEVRAGNVKVLPPRDSRPNASSKPTSQAPQAPVQAPAPQVDPTYANTIDTPF